MKPILKVTLVSDLLLCIGIGVSVLVSDQIAFAFYVSLLLFFNYFLPILIYTALYHFLLGKRHLHSSIVVSIILKALVLIVVSLVGLFIWALLEFFVIDSIKNFSWKVIAEDFATEYVGYLPVALVLAFLIPILYRVFTPKETASPA